MLICLEIVKHIEAQSFLVGGFFMDIQNIANHSSFIYKPTQEIDHKHVQKYDFNKYTLLQNKSGRWFRAPLPPPPPVHLRTDDVT